MSIFGSIVSAIFGSPHAASVTAGAASSRRRLHPRGHRAAAKPISQADVQAIVAKLAGEQSEKLDWKVSIVDLMKLLKLDSSLGARKQLAQELGYTGASRRLGGNEHLAAQAGHDEAGRERRQGAGQSQSIGSNESELTAKSRKRQIASRRAT